jgi:hypothetical protein
MTMSIRGQRFYQIFNRLNGSGWKKRPRLISSERTTTLHHHFLLDGHAARACGHEDDSSANPVLVESQIVQTGQFKHEAKGRTHSGLSTQSSILSNQWALKTSSRLVASRRLRPQVSS